MPTSADASDRYERDAFIAAPLVRVWAAITEPAQLKAWFAEPTYPLTPGGEGVLHFRFRDGTEDVDPVQVVAADPPYRFAFRWRSYPDDPAVPLAALPSTLVEITLVAEGEGTRIRIVESGFGDLPDDIRAASVRDNTHGWDEALRDLIAYVVRV